VISTLLPHLPHRRSAPFRIALLAGGVAMFALGFARLSGPAVAAAAIVVPLLYLLYLYEVEVYTEEPVWVIGSTFMVGLALGIPWALVAGPRLTASLVEGIGRGPSPSEVAAAGLLVPVVAQALMLAGALIVYATRRSYDEALDGFAFGAAGALGFTFSSVLINLFPELQQGLFSTAPPLGSALDVVQRGLLLPILNASTTGLIAAALWLHRGDRRQDMTHRVFGSVPAAVVIALVFQALFGVTGLVVNSAALRVLVDVLTVAVVLLWVRQAIHGMLLAEAVDVEIGPPVVCTHCHHVVPRMAFCPHCGIATRATPKTGEGRTGRTVRRVG
jgi:RsiW-degrading membrane proteinase PrsW (M82 family)